jgi:hypothetical protein
MKGTQRDRPTGSRVVLAKAAIENSTTQFVFYYIIMSIPVL